jgi:hypothetical protein
VKPAIHNNAITPNTINNEEVSIRKIVVNAKKITAPSGINEITYPCQSFP